MIHEVVRFCGVNKVPLERLKILAVVRSDGSFTSVRQATSIANALHWLTGAKLVAMSELPKEGKPLAPQSKVEWLTPHYTGEPNISQKKG